MTLRMKADALNILSDFACFDFMDSGLDSRLYICMIIYQNSVNPSFSYLDIFTLNPKPVVPLISSR